MLTAVVIHQPVSKIATDPKTERRGAANDDPDGLAAWEQKRLADPATGLIPAGIRRAELEFSKHIPSNSTRALDFVNRGPYNVGGRTRAFAMDVNNPNVLIAGSVSGSIYRSTDGGQTWTPSEVPAVSQGIVGLAQDTRAGHAGTWYACSGEPYGTSASGNGSNSFYLGNGLYKSIDNGVTWDTIASTNSNTPTTFDSQYDINWAVRIDASRMDSDIVYVAAYGAVYRTNNGGHTWKRVIGNPITSSATSYFTDVEVTPTGKVYATLSDDGGASKGIWRSTDGLAFTNILSDSFPTAYNRIVFAYAPSDENQLYFLANTPGFGTPDTNYLGDVEWNSFWKYTYVSGDGSGAGGVWENRSDKLPMTGGVFDKFTVQGSYDMVVAVKPNDPQYVVIGGTNLYRSTDGFATTIHTNRLGGYKIGAHLPVVESYPNHHSDQHVAFFHPTDYNVLYSSNDGGVWRTDDVNAASVTWTPLNNGYLATQFYTLAVDNATPNDPVIIGGAQDYGTWFTNNDNATAPWSHVYGGDGAYCAVADNKSAYYFSLQSGKMQRAVMDLNGSVTSFARIDPRGGKDFQFINPFTLDPVDQNVMYLPAGHKLWRNDNLAGIPMVSNWDSITTNWMTFPDTCTSAQGEITAVACSTTPAHTLYYGTDKRRVYKVTDANTGNPTRTDITGLTTPNIFPINGYVACIAVDSHDANRVVVVFSNYNLMSLFATTDGGATWSKVGGNLEQNANGTGNGPSCRWLSMVHLNDGILYYVATSTGLYMTDSLDGTNTVWTKQGVTTIGNTVCDMVVTRESDGLVAVATHGNGMFSTNLFSVGVHQPETGLSRVALFPNPSLEEVPVLSFRSQSNTPLRASVTDATGRILKSYDVDKPHAGTNTLALSGNSALPRGVYFVSVTQGQRFETVKWVKL